MVKLHSFMASELLHVEIREGEERGEESLN